MSAYGTVNTDARRFDPIRVAAASAPIDCSLTDSRLVMPMPVDSATVTPRSVAPVPESSHHSTTDRAGTATTTTDPHAHLHSSIAAAANPWCPATGKTADPEQSTVVRPEAGDNPYSCTSSPPTSRFECPDAAGLPDCRKASSERWRPRHRHCPSGTSSTRRAIPELDTAAACAVDLSDPSLCPRHRSTVA